MSDLLVNALTGQPAPAPAPARPPDPEPANPFAPGVMVWDKQTNTPRYIALADYDAAIAGGRFAVYGASKVDVAHSGGVERALPVGSATSLLDAGSGTSFVQPAAREQAAIDQRQGEALDNAADKAFTTMEGIGSALTFGAVKERGPSADARRRHLSGYNTIGEVVGTVAAFAVPGMGPVGALAKTSVKAGDAVARSALGVAKVGERGARAASRRAISEAVGGAGFAGTYATAHEALDAAIENKAFAGEHIASAVWSDFVTGGALGGALGGIGELFKQARSTLRSREWIEAQGGVLDATSAESARIHGATQEAVAGWDEALNKHREVSRSLDASIEGGELGAGGKVWSAERAAAIQHADAIRAKLSELDIPKILAGDDVAAQSVLLGYRRGDAWVPGLLDSYGDAVGKLDGYGPTADMSEWAAQRARYAQIVPEHAVLDADLPPAKPRVDGDELDETTPTQPVSSAGHADDIDSGAKAAPGSGTVVQKGKSKPKAPELVEADPEAKTDRELRAPRIDPASSRSPLAAFAHDVQQVAASLTHPTLDDIWSAMRTGGGKAPVAGKPSGKPKYTPERLRELVAEAEHAGYLKTTGERTYDVPHMGMKIGEAIEVSGKYADGAGSDIAWSKKERFPWEDKGARPGRTYKAADGTRKPADTVYDAKVPTGAMADPATPATPAGKPPAIEPDAPFMEPDSSSVPPLHPDTDFVESANALEGFARSSPQPIEPFSAASSARVREVLDEIHKVTDGRVGVNAALEAAEEAGLQAGPRGALSEALAGVVGLRFMARDLAESAKTGAVPSARRSKLLSKMGVRMGMSAGRSLAMGGNVMRSATGGAASVLGGHAVGMALGLAGNAAASFGRAKERVIKAGAALLSARVTRVVAALPATLSTSYDGSEPSEDLHVQVQQLQRAVASPEATKARFIAQLGDLGDLHPVLAADAAEKHYSQVKNLSMRAPVFVWSALGSPRPVGAQAVRKFREYQHATHNFEDLLAHIEAGTATVTQAEAFREQYPEALAELGMYVMKNRDKLEDAPREVLVAIERVTGMRLTNTNPEYAARQQTAVPPPQAATPPQPVSLNLTAPPPTPASAAFAPGNH